MERIDRADLPGLFRRLKVVFEAQREALIVLDGRFGDSDLGITMNKGFSAASDAVEGAEGEGLGKALQLAGMAMAKAAPSTMGTLMGGAIMRGGKALLAAEAIGAPEMQLFWAACRDGIAERGKAQPGDKTILDVLFPIAASLEQSTEHGRGLGEALELASTAAASGLEATKQMVAQHGKAACFQEASLGHQDAGATVGVLLIEAMRDFVRGDGA
ncbi:MAG: Dak phosphatase [Caulobacteraceae bacterium]|nr:Dak phosphatase [Caulobacteraceae bacterium]